MGWLEDTPTFRRPARVRQDGTVPESGGPMPVRMPVMGAMPLGHDPVHEPKIKNGREGDDRVSGSAVFRGRVERAGQQAMKMANPIFVSRGVAPRAVPPRPNAAGNLHHDRFVFEFHLL